MEKPDYVKHFIRPANTEIKYIRGHWRRELYLSENRMDAQPTAEAFL